MPNETTEKIIEAYFRYVKGNGHFTLTNVRCPNQKEIDLLAVNFSPEGKILSRYHIECSISISGAYSKLTAKPFSNNLKIAKPQQRWTVGYFVEKKFNSPDVLSKLADYGFIGGNYVKLIATWGWTPEAKETADKEGIELLDIRSVLKEIAKFCRDNTSHLLDDTLRTIQLIEKARLTES